MPTVAFHTLGCKVNQYDTQAMLECFQNAGYAVRGFDEPADVYVINTCTVTGTGDKKSMNAVRRAKRQNPAAQVVIAGCLAQRDAEGLLDTGARLIVGTARRGEVVTLLERAMLEGKQICAVENVTRAPFERLMITRDEGHTRAVMKIQEGCDRYCTYCIIPFVRGGIRSRAPEDIAQEARRLVAAGYREIVLTGIHLTSYGRDLDGLTLLDAIRAADVPGIERIRLGSLEPVIADEGFVRAISAIRPLCPQFHLALQSGSDGVLKRMRRRYDTAEFLAAVERLRAAFPHCAITTDVIAGFPGETEEEFNETLAFCEKVGFARMHVFPYSARKGTLAAQMPGQVLRAVREERARTLIALGKHTARAYGESLLGSVQPVLSETAENGASRGYTPQYMEVSVPGAPLGKIVNVRLDALAEEGFIGSLVEVEEGKEG